MKQNFKSEKFLWFDPILITCIVHRSCLMKTISFKCGNKTLPKAFAKEKYFK